MNKRIRMIQKVSMRKEESQNKTGEWLEDILKLAKQDTRKPHEKIIDTTLNRAPEIYGGLKSYYSTDPSTDCKNGLEHLHKRNYLQAHICFLRATRAGYPEGQYRLGGLYLYGRGVKQDLNMAEVLFCTAAEKGFLPEATDALEIVKRYREKHR